MLEVVYFKDLKRFGIRNTWTDVILSKNGKPRTYRTYRGAERGIRKRTTALNKSIDRLTRNFKLP